MAPDQSRVFVYGRGGWCEAPYIPCKTDQRQPNTHPCLPHGSRTSSTVGGDSVLLIPVDRGSKREVKKTIGHFPPPRSQMRYNRRQAGQLLTGRGKPRG